MVTSTRYAKINYVQKCFQLPVETIIMSPFADFLAVVKVDMSCQKPIQFKAVTLHGNYKWYYHRLYHRYYLCKSGEFLAHSKPSSGHVVPILGGQTTNIHSAVT